MFLGLLLLFYFCSALFGRKWWNIMLEHCFDKFSVAVSQLRAWNVVCPSTHTGRMLQISLNSGVTSEDSGGGLNNSTLTVWVGNITSRSLSAAAFTLLHLPHGCFSFPIASGIARSLSHAALKVFEIDKSWSTVRRMGRDKAAVRQLVV